MCPDRRNDRDPGSNGSNVKQCAQIDTMIETLVVMVVMLNNITTRVSIIASIWTHCLTLLPLLPGSLSLRLSGHIV